MNFLTVEKHIVGALSLPTVAQAPSLKQNILGPFELHGFLTTGLVSVYLRVVSEAGNSLVVVQTLLFPQLTGRLVATWIDVF